MADVDRQRARTRMEEQRGATGGSDAEQQRKHGARAPLPPQSERFLHGQSEHGHRQHDAPPALTPTSRLIVKGIPKYADEKRVRDHFSTHGQVTDVKVMRTRDGASRLFGFVGFASVKDAEAAQRYYNRTYMDASRLEVEFAQRVGSEEGRRGAWSKYTDGTSRNKELVRKSREQEREREREDGGLGEKGIAQTEAKKRKQGASEKGAGAHDPKLQEFLALMQPRHKKAVWANDDEMGMGKEDRAGAAEGGGAEAGMGMGAGTGPAAVAEEASDGEYEDMVVEEKEEAEEMEKENEKEKDAVVADTGVSDLEYMKARMTGTFSDDDEDDDDGGGDQEDQKDQDDEDEAREEDRGVNAVADDDEDDDGGADALGDDRQKTSRFDQDLVEDDDPLSIIAKSSRLFLRNLPYSANEDDIREFLEPSAAGDLDEVHIITDKTTRKSKGYALVTYEMPEDAVKAFQELDGSIFMGRLLHILPGKLAASRQADEDDATAANAGGDDAGSSFKKEKDAKLKGEAKSNKVAWNSLFMRADTVADAVADMYSMSKADLLDPSASDMAVRLALGEVKVINMTKEYLEEQGINIGSLEVAAAEAGGKKTKTKKKDGGSVKRSDAVLIVKNLPFALDEEELKGLFANAGPILRWILPPSHTMAVVEYGNNQDASKAFKTLAFKRYRSVPIYLEWAPRDIFEGGGGRKKAADDDKRQTETKAKTKNAASAADPLVLITTEDADEAASSTVFVKNLAFKTKKADFEKHFRAAVEACGGELRSAKISTRKKDNKMVSAGFGFVECSSESVAKDVIKKMQGSALDGHNLVLQIAAAGARGAAKNNDKTPQNGAKKQNTKISVKNLAFEATRQDVLNLFTALGEVKSCRLPKKFDGTHRGFAFVDFASAAEAKTAISSISGTHLYGRRLVLEYAAEEQEQVGR